jgi:hypothetical protein
VLSLGWTLQEKPDGKEPTELPRQSPAVDVRGRLELIKQKKSQKQVHLLMISSPPCARSRFLLALIISSSLASTLPSFVPASIACVAIVARSSCRTDPSPPLPHTLPGGSAETQAFV